MAAVDLRRGRWRRPADWPKGFELVWPLREQGLALILRPDSAANLIVSLFPFFAEGSQQTLRLRSLMRNARRLTQRLADGSVTMSAKQKRLSWHEHELSRYEHEAVSPMNGDCRGRASEGAASSNGSICKSGPPW